MGGVVGRESWRDGDGDLWRWVGRCWSVLESLVWDGVIAASRSGFSLLSWLMVGVRKRTSGAAEWKAAIKTTIQSAQHG